MNAQRAHTTIPLYHCLSRDRKSDYCMALVGAGRRKCLGRAFRGILTGLGYLLLMRTRVAIARETCVQVLFTLRASQKQRLHLLFEQVTRANMLKRPLVSCIEQFHSNCSAVSSLFWDKGLFRSPCDDDLSSFQMSALAFSNWPANPTPHPSLQQQTHTPKPASCTIYVTFL
jgi:hypothetical protein